MAITKFCLVLMAWGNKYTNRHINYIYNNASQSVGLTQTLLITDRIRDGVSDEIKQTLIPEWFNKPEFFNGGYPVKLSILWCWGIYSVSQHYTKIKISILCYRLRAVWV